MIQNCTFQNITFINNIISLTNQNYSHFSLNTFEFITGTIALLYISNVNCFILDKTILKYITAYSIYFLENMNFNYNFEIVAISNSLVYFWKNDQTCKKTFMENSLLKNNIFQISVFANLQVPNASVYWSYMTIIDNFMSLRPIIKILEGICNLTNVTIIHNIFPNPNNLHYVFSFESDNKVYITNSQFIDNGAGGRKKVYLSAYEGALINLWSMTYSYFDNNLFISSEMAELGSGFISASPHGGIFILYNSTFIILNTNTNYQFFKIIV